MAKDKKQKTQIGGGTLVVVFVGLGLFLWLMYSIDNRTPRAPRPKPPAAQAVRQVGPTMDELKKQAGDMVTFRQVLGEAGIDRASIIEVGWGQHPHQIKITVANSWHLDHHQVRLQAAQVLWQAWARIHTPQEPDLSRIVLVDGMGNEVGGSRIWAGSLIWVKD